MWVMQVQVGSQHADRGCIALDEGGGGKGRGTHCVRDVASDRVHNGSRLHCASGSTGQQGRVQEVVARGHQCDIIWSSSCKQQQFASLQLQWWGPLFPGTTLTFSGTTACI